MRLIHKILLVLLALTAIFTIWFYAGARLQGRATYANARAADYPEAFSAAASIVRSGAAPQRFSDASLDIPTDYERVDAYIHLKNRGLFAAEWLEITVNPGAGDVAVYSVSGAAQNIAAMSEGQVNVKLITTNAAAERSVTIRYYVFGMYKSVTVQIP